MIGEVWHKSDISPEDQVFDYILHDEVKKKKETFSGMNRLQ